MKNNMKYILFSLLVVILATVFISLSNPLRKSEIEIKGSLLKITPIGTSMEDVLKVIEKNKDWKILQDGAWLSWPSSSNITTKLYKDTFIKTKSIEALIGRYINFFVVNVGAYWKFDENLKLTDILVRKEGGGF